MTGIDCLLRRNEKFSNVRQEQSQPKQVEALRGGGASPQREWIDSHIIPEGTEENLHLYTPKTETMIKENERQESVSFLSVY